MNRKIMLLCVSVLFFTVTARAQQSELLKQVVGQYWGYENSVWDSTRTSVHTFLLKMNEGQVQAKGTGMLFEDNGTFTEIADVTKIGGAKPCKGTWVAENNNTLKVNCGGKVWHYKVLKVDKGALLVTIKN